MAHSLRLAITTIGDLLLYNKISCDNNGGSIDNIELKIPDYQRPYKWTAKNVTQLLDDIIVAKCDNKEIYRVGTLILHSQDNNDYNIVDGQQRIITFSLLLKSILNNNTEEGIKDTPISFLDQTLSDNPNNRRNIPNNYRVLERRINQIINKKEIYDYISNHCELIVVITNDLSEAFQFFDSQNARGKKLYPHDLLKAYHLREMKNEDATETEKVVKIWEDMNQNDLSKLFSDYLYRIKEWAKGNRAKKLTEHNIQIFKGVTRQDSYPYAMFYKGAYSYAASINHSAIPFVSGIRNLRPFQLDTPIVAGRPFFDYSKYYFDILNDIQNNDKYYGYYVNDNKIVKTLNLRKYKNGVGNRIVRLLFDSSILLYVDRFCPERPSKNDTEMLDNFIIFAFVWAYSLRAQYYNVGWLSTQNYIMGNEKINSINLFRVISDSNSPSSLLSTLSDCINPLSKEKIVAQKDNIEDEEDGVYLNYLYYFKQNQFLED